MFRILERILDQFRFGSRRAMPPKRKSEQEPKARGKAKAKASAIAPLLDAENAAALASTGQVSDSFYKNFVTIISHSTQAQVKYLFPGHPDRSPVQRGAGDFYV